MRPAKGKEQANEATRPIDVAAGMATAYWDYAVDAWQRSILFLDVLRDRGNQYLEHARSTVPHVLNFEFELVMDGRNLPRPVNYGLVRITPPADMRVDAKKRPFVVVDPRAGHGPGIGGFKADSEIGVAMRAGHPCYFIGFLPEPVSGQTIEDIMQAEAVFMERVIGLHPDADGKPCVIGNCQAGWAVMMLAATRPDLFGPIIVAGSPLSYWGGTKGGSPMRYSGGLMGGSWPTALTSDLGGGKFDGAWLVTNFEGLNPANTLWTKQYNVWAKADTEGKRYLEFERWWGGHVNLNADEIQFIVDELFVGNRLATAEIVTRDGVRIDLRKIRSPILCFCSHGDNITPPQQALGWITDLYRSVDDLRAHGQTIVYSVHDTIGHLGIFVSGKVAAKEHAEFASNIDLVDVLAPGLYEAVLVPVSDKVAGADLAAGDWILRFEPRTLDDLHALGGNDEADERRFAAARRVSEINLGLYRTFVQPFVRASANPSLAPWMTRLHPARLQFELFSDANPFMAMVSGWADQVRKNRKPAARDNPFVKMQGQVSEQVISALDGWGTMRDRAQEQFFLTTYGSPWLQAMLGLKADDGPPRRRPADEPETIAFRRQRIAELREGMTAGGLREAAIRSLIYVGLGHGIDERHFAVLRRIRERYGTGLNLQDFKRVLREQFLMLVIDEAAALAAIPSLLPDDAESRAAALAAIREVIEATGEPGEQVRGRLARIESMFAAPALPAPPKEIAASRRKPAVAIPARPPVHHS